MSLFQKLRRFLHRDPFPAEDFLTEIFAQVLLDHPEFARQWLQGLNWSPELHRTFGEDGEMTAVTQLSLGALKEHAAGSRPDISLHFPDSSGGLRVLVECKVRAKQGYQQLFKYAGHLRTLSHSSAVALVFLTQSEQTISREDFDSTIPFAQTRWQDVVSALEAWPSTPLVRELVLYLKANDMHQRHKFSDSDRQAMRHFNEARRMMNAVLDGKVATEFGRVANRKLRLRSAMTQLIRHDRYAWSAPFGSIWDMEFLLGFWPEDDGEDGPWIGAMIYVNPNSKSRSAVVAAMEGFVRDHPAWQQGELSNVHDWVAIFRGQKHKQFRQNADEITAMKDYLVKLVEEMAAFMKQNPKLPWQGAVEVEADEEA